MKRSGFLAVLLSASIPSGAFAQSLAASRAAGASAEAGMSGAAGTVSIPAFGLGALPPLSLSPSPLAPGLVLVQGAVPSAAPSVAQVAAIPALPAALAIAAAAKPDAAARVAASIVPLTPAALVPAALSRVPAAAAKDGKDSEAGWTGKLAAMFDGGAELKAFVVRHGAPMIEITLAEAASRKGQVRLLTAKNDPSGLNEKDAARIGALVNAKVRHEALFVDWSPKAAEPSAAAAERAATTLGSKLLWPVREARFLAKTFAASLVKPLPSEILGGIATKSFPLVTSIAVYWTAVGLAHPVALAGLIGLSVVQEVFHGFFLKSWNNFQESLRSERGFNYQMFFNLAYMQGFGTLYRMLSWTANPASVTPPWSVHYWKDMAVMSVVGTFFGVLGYNSLNALYAKGSISRWQHSGIQQVRDLCFLLAAPFFASGSMTMFWGIFLFQQSLDLAIAIWAGRAQAREIVFVTSAPVAASAEFQKKYPLAGAVIEPPLKQAAKAVFDNPLVRVMTWPARALWKAARGKK